MIGGTASFSVGILAAVVLYALASIYGFDYYEPNWGRGISLQVSIGIAIVLALIGAIGFGIGARVFRATPTRARGLVAGAVVGGLLFLLATLQDRVVSTTEGRQLLVGGVVLALSFIAALPFRSKRRASV